MNEPRVNLDPAGMKQPERDLHDPLEDQLTSALRDAVERVSAEYAGESVEEVAARLLDEARAGLHPDVAEGFRPDPADLRRLAREIVADHGEAGP